MASAIDAISVYVLPLRIHWSELAQSCPTLRPHGLSLPGSIHEIFQARILEWVAISFSRGSSQSRDQTQVFCIAGRCFTVWANQLRFYSGLLSFRMDWLDLQYLKQLRVLFSAFSESVDLTEWFFFSSLLMQCMPRAQSCPTLVTLWNVPARLLCP